MKRLLLAAAMAVAVVPLVSLPTPAFAQMAGAIGKPLPSPDLEVGTISVRIVAGAPSSPVTGTDVTLVVNGTPRIVRTDTAGRAFFKGLPPGASVQAKVLDEDKKEVTSDTFEVPAQGGARVMLTTRPWNPGAASMPAGGAGGAGGMPNPRQMSGEPRPEQSDPPGQLTARVAYDDFKDVAANTSVALVGYRADDTIDLQVVNTDAEGRAVFKGLDRTGATSYFAMTLLERGGKLDRLISVPAVLDSRQGLRLILSSEKRDSTAAQIDDLTKFEKQDSPPPAGKVLVSLEGGVDENTPVSLVEITPTARRVFATGKIVQGPPDPSDVQAQADFTPKSDVPAGTVVVTVHGGVNNANGGLADVAVNVSSAAQFAERQGQIDGKTDSTGAASITVDPKQQGPFVATVTINGKTLTSKPFELAKNGGELEVEAHWSGDGKPQVLFDVVPRPGQVFLAETTMHGQLYRTLPFQPVPDRGTRVTIFVFPRILFTFSLTSRVDDEYLAVSGRFEVSNNAWAPYVGKDDGLLVPLPKGFTGGLVAEKDQGDVALAQGEGFRIIRPLAPGQRQFHGAFSLPVRDGGVSWRLDLPYGSFNSGMEIMQVPGMQVSTPPGVNGQVMTVPQGTFYVLPQISILPKQSMVMSISGLPSQPGWKIWLPRIFGVFVIVIILGGLAFALMRKSAGGTDSDRETRRQKLLDELVELERSGKNAKRREQIMAELEKLWDAA